LKKKPGAYAVKLFLSLESARNKSIVSHVRQVEALTFAAAGFALLTTVARCLCNCYPHNTECEDQRHRGLVASARWHCVLSLLLLQGYFGAGDTSVRGVFYVHLNQDRYNQP
jgi:hypothetical protein